MLLGDHKNTLLSEASNGVVNQVAHTAYGHASAQQPISTQLHYNGQFSEPQTGWQLLGNGYRAYNPRLMKFLSPDSLSPFGEGGVNRYAYCEGEPVLSADPDGHSVFGNILRMFRPTTIQAENAKVPNIFLQKPGSKTGPASVRPIQHKDVERLKTVVRGRESELNNVDEKWGERSRTHGYEQGYDRKHGLGSFRNEAMNDIGKARYNLENSRELKGWASNNVGKIGITKEASKSLKATADKFAASASEVRKERKQQYFYMQQAQFDKRNERAGKEVKRRFERSFLGDGKS